MQHFAMNSRMTATGVARRHQNPGIKGHDDGLNEASRCPGSRFYRQLRDTIVPQAIRMANTFDAAESIRRGPRSIPQINTEAQSITWARNSNMLSSPPGSGIITISVGSFIISVNNWSRFRTTIRATSFTAAAAITHLSRNSTPLIPPPAEQFWQNNHHTVANLGALLISVARWID